MSNLSDAKQLKRPPYQKRTVIIRGVEQRDLAAAMVANCPIDPHRPLAVTLGEQVKARGLDQNALMWSGPLREIAEQAWVEGRQYTAEVWHAFFKRSFLFEDDDIDLAEMVKEGYRKWDYDPEGERILVGSTTQLTKRGFSNYLEQIFAYGAGLGVHLHESPGRDR